MAINFRGMDQLRQNLSSKSQGFELGGLIIRTKQDNPKCLRCLCPKTQLVLKTSLPFRFSFLAKTVLQLPRKSKVSPRSSLKHLMLWISWRLSAQARS